MRKTLLATVAAVGLLTATPTAEAQFVVIDPANLAQNILQVFEAIEEGIRTLRQIELALQAVTGTDFSISPQIQGALGEVTRVLNSEVVGIVFEELEALEAFREIYPEVFDAIDSFEQLVTLVRQQSNNLISASRLAVATQSVSVEAIEDILANVEDEPRRVDARRRPDPGDPGRQSALRPDRRHPRPDPGLAGGGAAGRGLEDRAGRRPREGGRGVSRSLPRQRRDRLWRQWLRAAGLGAVAMESLQVLDQILAFFDTALNAAIPILDGNVRFLFQTFLVLSIVFAGATYAFGNTSVGLEYLMKKILLVGFMIFILTNWLPFTNIVINSFGLLGLQTGGLSTVPLTVADLFEPSRIAGLGVGLADQLLERANEIGGLFSSEIGTFLLLVGASLVLALSFILIALQVFMLLIEFKLVTLGGFILLPFALLDRTTSLAQGALGYVIAASLKVFVIAVVVSFAIAFVSTLTLSEEITSTEGFAAIGVSLDLPLARHPSARTRRLHDQRRSVARRRRHRADRGDGGRRRCGGCLRRCRGCENGTRRGQDRDCRRQRHRSRRPGQGRAAGSGEQRPAVAERHRNDSGSTGCDSTDSERRQPAQALRNPPLPRSGPMPPAPAAASVGPALPQASPFPEATAEAAASRSICRIAGKEKRHEPDLLRTTPKLRRQSRPTPAPTPSSWRPWSSAG